MIFRFSDNDERRTLRDVAGLPKRSTNTFKSPHGISWYKGIDNALCWRPIKNAPINHSKHKLLVYIHHWLHLFALSLYQEQHKTLKQYFQSHISHDCAWINIDNCWWNTPSHSLPHHPPIKTHPLHLSFQTFTQHTLAWGKIPIVPTSLFGDCVVGTLSVGSPTETHIIDCEGKSGIIHKNPKADLGS